MVKNHYLAERYCEAAEYKFERGYLDYETE